ncbi:MAG: arginine deiminase family protein [Acidobacteriota bacterium]
MKICIESELDPLKTVLVHRPGLEVDRMVPSMMERLLFDDILYGAEARREHGLFCTVLERAGVEVLRAGELLADALAEDGARDFVLGELSDLDAATIGVLRALPAEELASALIEGLPDPDRESSGRFFLLDPLPNYFFQRDPQIMLGRQVMISAMATTARGREPLLARTLFSFHPELAPAFESLAAIDGLPSAAPTLDPTYPYPTVEGGDVLVPSPEVILIGVSERTNRWGVEALAESLRCQDTSFRHLIVVELPRRRSYMHLDTVFTFIDRDLCLGFPPVIDPGTPQSAHVYRVDLDAPQLAFTVQTSLVRALAEVGLEVEILPCGGAELLHQEREQWTDGANAFAIEPGVILLYRRNRYTLDELDRRGWRVVGEEDVAAGEPVVGHGPTVVTLGGNELSRARGGPRCMTMALERGSR